MQSDEQGLERDCFGLEGDNPQQPAPGHTGSGSGNVRSRVRYWLNDIVDEMRKKSPASVQKWVDSIQIPTPTVDDSTARSGPSSSQLAGQQKPANPVELHSRTTESGESESEFDRDINEDVLREEDPVITSDEDLVPTESPVATESKSRSIKCILSKKLEKFSRSSVQLEQDDPGTTEQKQDPHVAESRKSSSLSSIGKIKINEFYDKLSLNKAKYNLMKTKKIGIRNMLGTSKENLTQKMQQRQLDTFLPKVSGVSEDVNAAIAESTDESKLHQSEQASEKLSSSDIYEFSFDETFPKDDDLPDASEDEEKENFDIPEESYSTYLIPPKSCPRIGIGRIGRSSSENPRTNKRFNLLEIGRSFSEMNDDDNFVINECNNSCPNPSSLNTSSSINNSSSNILARSVPVSPVPRTSSKISIQQDNSLSEFPRRRSAMLIKDSSLQSDSSRCSSVESLLNARKPDPEKILLNLGFGPAPHSGDVLSKIPKRFLKPSQVRGVDTEAFLRQQQLSMHIHENSVLGYRGLVGNPHIPPSMIVAKIMERFQENERGRLVRSSTIAAGMSRPAPTGHLPESRNSSGPPSPIPILRHSSLAS
ncbi:uncharacterized protein LOC131694095 isoform X1 [Topomyia yanbarensis]|uniref:uncharacterized protein LOC131694095 isoform X1 n=2 Tax=Topomyia yanbarensis TaxID=2498891 RepID=UPI00273CE35C|nr:uncharacterized protein LOC131694095 isoform X1 [Topomyia yanbarensis]